MEISFCDLRAKVVVNLFDGRQLGHIIDMIIDTSCSRILGLVLPCEKNLFCFFKSSGNIFIPYNRICKIGKDVILVDLNISNQQNIRILEEKNKTKQKTHSTQSNKSQSINQEFDYISNKNTSNYGSSDSYTDKAVFDYYNDKNRNHKLDEY